GAGRRRVDVLAAPEAREAVGRHDDDLAHRAAADQPVEALAEARLPGAALEHHLAGAGEPGQPVDHRIAALRRRGVRWWQPDRGAPAVRIAEWISLEHAAVD